MKVNGQHYHTIWEHSSNSHIIQIIDQRALPHKFKVEDLVTVDDVLRALMEMHVRGAGLIGATGAYGMYLAALQASREQNGFTFMAAAAEVLKAARPTAINLAWAIQRQLHCISADMTSEELVANTLTTARAIAHDDVQACYQIGQHGLSLIHKLSSQKTQKTFNILTHCNAGWLAFVDHGSATAPIYAAHDAGLSIHVWVDETRPQNQGTRLTAWELEQHGVPFTIITDNAGGHLMQQGLVDLVLVGSDRTTFSGDVANKIGTYLKALAATDNHIPFYAALPSSSFDWNLVHGVQDIPIEHRSPEEIKFIQGLLDGRLETVRLSTPTAPALNVAFDVTPARLVTGLITERGICQANAESIFTLFPEKRVHV